MSTTVDNRVVQMRFDNEEFEKKASKSLSTLDRLKNALKFSGASKNLNKVNKSLKEVDANPLLKAIEGINGGFTTMVAKATLVNRATNALIDTTKRFVSSMTLDQVNAGWDKYAEKTSAVQTIMAATSKDFKDTGVQMSYVNGQLEKLNWFTDETSYNFTDMVGNIGKFTSNGIKLDKSVTAMQGIATWAARSGANANEASRAMYNLSQALSTGAVKLIDWKSIENANMATAEFKENAIEAAVALGKLKKKGDGTYVTMKNNAVSVQNFNNALSDAWFTSDVLLNVLDRYGGFTNELYKVSEETGLTATELLTAINKYEQGSLNLQEYASKTGVDAYTLKKNFDKLSDSTYDLGRKSFQSAQEAKTFAEAISATSDAVSTKWMATFEILFGDYEEAKTLWTGLANVLYDVFAASGDTRNALLKDWKSLGGRNDVLKAFQNIFDVISGFSESIANGFRDVFPEKTALQLYEITERLWRFTESITISDDTADKLQRTARGLFSILDIGKHILIGISTGFKQVLSAILPVGSDFLSLTASIGDFIVSVDESLKKSQAFTTIFSKIGSAMSLIIGVVRNFVQGFAASIPSIGNFENTVSSLSNVLINIARIIGEIVGTILNGIRKIFSGRTSLENINDLFSIFNIGILAAIARQVVNFFRSINGSFGNGSKIFETFKELFDSLGESIEAWGKGSYSKILKNVAVSIAILAVSLAVLSTIDPVSMATSLGAITILFKELMISMESLIKILSSKSLIKVSGAATVMIAMSAAIAILAGAVKNLSDIGWEGLLKGLGSVGILLFALNKSMTALIGDKSLRFIKGASSLIALAIAIRILSESVKTMSDIDIGSLAKGLISVSALLGALTVFSNKASAVKIGSGLGFIAIAASLAIIAKVVRQLSDLNVGQLAKGLISIAAVLLELSIFSNTMPKGLIQMGVGLIAISTSLLIVSKVLQSIGQMSVSSIGKSLIALAGTLTILAIAVRAFKSTVSGVVAIVALSNALVVLAVGLKMLGSMSILDIGKSLLALVGSIGILAGAAALLTPVIPAMIAIAGAIALLGVASLGVGIGISALAMALSMLSVAGSAGIQSLIELISSIIQLIPMLVEQFALGLVSLAKTIGEHAPEFVTAGLELLSGLLEGLCDNLPKIIETGLTIIITLLKTIRYNISEFVGLGIDIIVNFVKGISEKLELVANAAFDVVIKFITTVGKVIKERTPELVQAFITLAKDVIEGFVGGIFSGVSSVVDAVKELGSKAISTLRTVFRSHSPSEETNDIGEDYDAGLANGITDGKGRVVGAAQDLASDAVKATRDTLNGSQLDTYNELYNVWSKRTRQFGKQQAALRSQQAEAQSEADAELLKKQDDINRELKKKYAKRSKDLKALESATLASQQKTTEALKENTVDGIEDAAVQAIEESLGAFSASGTKAADTFLTAFESKLSDLDLDLSTIDLEQELWEATIGKTASEQDKKAKETEVITEKIKIQNEKVDQANQKYEYTVKKMGKTSEDAKKAYQQLLQEQIDLANLMSKLDESRNTVADNSTDAMVAYAQYIAESQDDLLKMGFTMEQISAAAAERTGYNLKNTTQTMTDSVTGAVSTAMNTVSDTYLATAESTLGALTTNFENYGVQYATSIGSGMVTTTSAVTAGAQALTTAGKNQLTQDSGQWYTLGQMCAEGFKQGILSKADEIATAAAAVANAAFSAVQVAIDSHSPSRKFMWLGEMAGLGMSIGFQNMEGEVSRSATRVSEETITAARDTIGQLADIIDTDPTLHPQIAPVVDLTQVRSGFNKLGSMKTPVISTYVTGARVNAVASSLSSHENGIKQPVPQNNQNGPQVVEFVQNNYSPKSLSRSEIYRNTNNQFTAFKEAISKV